MRRRPSGSEDEASRSDPTSTAHDDDSIATRAPHYHNQHHQHQSLNHNLTHAGVRPPLPASSSAAGLAQEDLATHGRRRSNGTHAAWGGGAAAATTGPGGTVASGGSNSAGVGGVLAGTGLVGGGGNISGGTPTAIAAVSSSTAAVAAAAAAAAAVADNKEMLAIRAALKEDDTMREHERLSRRRLLRLRNPWSCAPLTLAVMAAAVMLILVIAQSFLHRQLDAKGCAMSYMSSTFVHFPDFDNEHTRFASKYSLYLYREGGIDEDPRV